MSEYIDREAAEDAVGEAHLRGLNPLWELRDVPAADVVSVVHGRWDDSGRYTFPRGNAAVRCTNCGCALTESEYRLNNWNYCPVCGAKMDGGADNG